MNTDLVWVPIDVIRSQKLSSSAKMFWIYMHEQSIKNECTLTQEEMALQLGVAVKSISRYIKELRIHGYLEVVDVKGKKAFNYKTTLPILKSESK